MSQELEKFPFYGSGSPKAQASQAEVDKMLGKGSLEVVGLLGLGYCSHQFLVQKATRRWRVIIDFSAFSHYETLTSFRMEVVASVPGLIRKGNVCFRLT